MKGQALGQGAFTGQIGTVAMREGRKTQQRSDESGIAGRMAGCPDGQRSGRTLQSRR